MATVIPAAPVKAFPVVIAGLTGPTGPTNFDGAGPPGPIGPTGPTGVPARPGRLAQPEIKALLARQVMRAQLVLLEHRERPVAQVPGVNRAYGSARFGWQRWCCRRYRAHWNSRNRRYTGYTWKRGDYLDPTGSPGASGSIGSTGATGPAGAGSPSNVLPLMDGTATVGTLMNFSREDHIHPSDTTRATVASVPVVTTTTPVMDGTATIGASGKWADGAHVHPTDTSRYAASNPADYQTAAQVTTSLGAYLPLTGGTVTGPLLVSNTGGALSVQSSTAGGNSQIYLNDSGGTARGVVYWEVSTTSLVMNNFQSAGGAWRIDGAQNATLLGTGNAYKAGGGHGDQPVTFASRTSPGSTSRASMKSCSSTRSSTHTRETIHRQKTAPRITSTPQKQTRPMSG